ncbi:phosphatase PAP2 family protein [Blastococcus xanthinilyticus]|uniref:5'-phosphoribosyl-monophospho-decaprenol phosphatase n=1 Tax=Blastococcus xanthinilyticus TaxID=1564164 RepID=A0A5S5D3W5_9ACTN|nr:phosphatase PAP2 family protein [Blastococcus xanthinilyticus]TYP89866.1 5'-phosphoribosyl-monophospho-decaprenol phosphatase [Blastococcus xanthinilyticus]
MTEGPLTRLTRLDEQLLRATRRRLGHTPAVPVAKGLSLFGEHAAGWLALGAVGYLRGSRRAEWAQASVGVFAGHAAGVVVKRVVRRQRPAFTDLPALARTAGKLSFPSAHSCSTAAAAVGFGPLIGRPVMGTALGAMLVSRVLLGVHYPSDVAAGAAIGGLSAVTVRTLARRARERGQQ